MKPAITALVSMVLLVTLTIGGFFLTAPAPVQAAPSATLVDCQLVVGPTTRVVCTLAGETVLNTVVDLPTVTLPPLPQATVTAPGATVTVSPPQATATVTAPAGPRATETVTVNVPVPGPTSTETVKVEVPTNGSTATVTLPPKPGKTVTQTVKPNGQPVPTVTETTKIVEEVTGQPTVGSGTIDPNGNTGKKDEDFLRFDLDLGDESVSAGEASVGILGALVILALILAGMYYGFRRGMAVVNREEAYFLRDMLQK